MLKYCYQWRSYLNKEIIQLHHQGIHRDTIRSNMVYAISHSLSQLYYKSSVREDKHDFHFSGWTTKVWVPPRAQWFMRFWSFYLTDKKVCVRNQLWGGRTPPVCVRNQLWGGTDPPQKKSVLRAKIEPRFARCKYRFYISPSSCGKS